MDERQLHDLVCNLIVHQANVLVQETAAVLADDYKLYGGGKNYKEAQLYWEGEMYRSLAHKWSQKDEQYRSIASYSRDLKKPKS